jgi:hypothetical protein
MSLTDRQILALRPNAKQYKVFDGGGLHIYSTCPRREGSCGA